MRNQKQYIQAKTITEPILCDIFKYMLENRILWHGKYIKSVRIGTKDEDYEHKDIIIKFKDGSEEYYDAKHQDPDNKGKTSYSVSDNIIKYLKGNKIDDRYYFALMEYERPWYTGNSWINQAQPTGRFAILPMNKAKLTKRDCDTTVVDISEEENQNLIEWIE